MSSKVSKRTYRTSYNRYYNHYAGYVPDDRIDESYWQYITDIEKKITNPKLTNATKGYILTELLNDDYELTKEEIDELTYKIRKGQETLDIVYDYYLQQRRLRNQPIQEDIKTDLGIGFKGNDKQKQLLRYKPEFIKAQQQATPTSKFPVKDNKRFYLHTTRNLFN